MAFLGRTVNVEDSLRFRVDERCRFERLVATVVLARVLSVEKRRIDCGVTGGLIQLYRQMQHSPYRHLDPIKRFD